MTRYQDMQENYSIFFWCSTSHLFVPSVTVVLENDRYCRTEVEIFYMPKLYFELQSTENLEDDSFCSSFIFVYLNSCTYLTGS